ncbi:MAG: HAMP domain-containing protein [Desulfobacterales bacterium]|nr:HAMP domain-containing protein [Desulfobacterales bacterium]
MANLKIATRMKLSFVLVLLVPFAIATSYSILYYSDKIKHEALQKISSDLKVALLIYNNKVKAVEDVARAYTSKESLKMYTSLGLNGRLQKQMARMLPDDGRYFSCAVNPNGEIIGQPGKTFHFDQFLKTALAGGVRSGSEATSVEELKRQGVVLNEMVGSGETDVLILTASSPIYTPGGKDVIGAFIVRRVLNGDAAITREIHGLLAVDVSIYGSGGRLITSSVSNAAGEARRAEALPAPVKRSVLDRGKSFERAVIERSGHLAKYQPIPGLDANPVGALMVRCGAEPYIITRDTAILGMIFIASTGCVLAILIGFRLSRRISRGLEKLARGARTVADGNYSQVLNVSQDDEIGELARNFNQMSQNLKKSFEQIEKQNEELARVKGFLDNIINSMPSVLVGVDARERVTHWNWEAQKVTGLEAKDARGLLLTDVFPQIAEQMEGVRRAFREREPRKEEKVARKSDGELRYSDIMVYPLIANGIEGAVIRIDDVTERVRIEEMMIQTEKMLSVGGLAAGMAHEINNPLAGILQNAQVIQNRIFGELPKNRRTAEACGVNLDDVRTYVEKRGLVKMLDAVMSSGRRAAKIVDNMLSFSRKSESKASPRDMGKMIDKTLELAENDYDLKKKYDFRKIEIIREYDPDGPMVQCEETKIQQVLLNILKNGAQAMAEFRSLKPGGEKSGSRFILRTRRDGRMGRLEIEDNGPGMNEETRKRIFEPFFTTKEVGVGTGLGLSVSYFIITENHSGAMHVESTPGKGAAFIIKLPLVEET